MRTSRWLPLTVVASSLGLLAAATLADGRGLTGPAGPARPGFGIEGLGTPRAAVPTPSARSDVERSIRRVERDVQRRTDEAELRRSGTRGDLERYRTREHRRDRLAEIREELSGAPPTATEEVDRVLGRVDFDRRVEALEQEIRGRERAGRLEP